jgi:hypothetical protein
MPGVAKPKCMAAVAPAVPSSVSASDDNSHVWKPQTRSVAVFNVAHDKSEREIDRKLKAHSPSDHVYFDMVTLEGTLKLRNFETRTVEVIISNRVPGKPTAAPDGGSISVDPTKLKLLEREGTVRWQLKLEPGEEKTLTYQYERYVPSN